MELLCQLAWVGVRARGRWSRLHQQLSARVVGRLVYAWAADAAEHNPVGENEGEPVGAGYDALLDLLGAVIERAGDDILAGEGQRGRPGGCGALHREAVGYPIDLAERIVVDVEAELLEPGGGSRAHVAQRIPAVDDDRALAVQLVGVLRVELLQLQAHGTGEV